MAGPNIIMEKIFNMLGFGKNRKNIAGRGRYLIGKTERQTANLFMIKIFYRSSVYFVVQCVVLGDGGVGKTSLLMSYAQDKFPDDYTATGESTLLYGKETS
jgi:hypothetical protein